jgi:hypothetical protein
MLVIMEDRDVEQVLQLGFNPEAVGAGDVFKIDAAEGRADVADDLDEGVGVGGGHLDVERIQIREPLEQNRLAFHHRLGGERSKVAKAQDGGAVGDDPDEVTLRGVVVGRVRILGDLADGRGDARRVGEAEVALGGHRFGSGDRDLAGLGVAVKIERFLVCARAAFLDGHGAVLSVRCGLASAQSTPTTAPLTMGSRVKASTVRAGIRIASTSPTGQVQMKRKISSGPITKWPRINIVK